MWSFFCFWHLVLGHGKGTAAFTLCSTMRMFSHTWHKTLARVVFLTAHLLNLRETNPLFFTVLLIFPSKLSSKMIEHFCEKQNQGCPWGPIIPSCIRRFSKQKLGDGHSYFWSEIIYSLLDRMEEAAISKKCLLVIVILPLKGWR